MNGFRKNRPVALTIAGSDSGGGAGIQADLKTFAALKVHGASAITCLTAQNPRTVTGIQAADPAMVRKQIEAVFAELRPAAAKTGMLFAAPIIRAVAATWRRRGRGVPLVVDPVMAATSGARLLRSEAIAALERLLPLATLVTPNLDEAAILSGFRPDSVESMRRAARIIHERFGCAVLVKGGHLTSRQAVDVLRNGRREMLFTAPFFRSVSPHGAGCTFSAAITAWLARGASLAVAVKKAKRFITRAVAKSYRIGRHTALEPRE